MVEAFKVRVLTGVLGAAPRKGFDVALLDVERLGLGLGGGDVGEVCRGLALGGRERLAAQVNARIRLGRVLARVRVRRTLRHRDLRGGGGGVEGDWPPARAGVVLRA